MDIVETRTQRVKQLCRKLRPVIGPRIDKIWQVYLIEDNKGKEEIEEYLTLLTGSVIDNRFDKDEIFLYPPFQEKAAGEYYIGDVSARFVNVCHYFIECQSAGNNCGSYL